VVSGFVFDDFVVSLPFVVGAGLAILSTVIYSLPQLSAPRR
jgi:hypothetical protein